jgi:branched-chain amino acid transport system ATP-binding protein
VSEPLLQVEGLTAGYDGAAVLRDFDLSVGEGEIVALLGANGAGKTTTLRAISGLVKPISGSVAVFGADIAKTPPHRLFRRGLAHVAEGRSIFFDLTVAEHFRLGHRGEKLDSDRAFEYFPKLRELQNRRAGVLSGGEQQMLALARALARSPRLLLIDELSLGLAPVIVEQLLPVVRRFVVEENAGAVVVEQHVELALGIADHGVVLSHGEVKARAAAETLEKDKEILLASYLGEATEAESI